MEASLAEAWDGKGGGSGGGWFMARNLLRPIDRRHGNSGE
jgi:hypothetical protein